MKVFSFKNSTVPFELVRSGRAKRISIIIYPGGKVVVRIPIRALESRAEHFVQSKAEWILRQRHAMEKKVPGISLGGGKKHYREHKEAARKLLSERVRHFNQFYGFSYKSISIKNQASRWGSCSLSGNLNFNYRLLFVEEALRDYVVVHELCHLKEHNHGKGFWNLVARVVPDYTLHRKALKRYTF